jgi:hypothetical protein
MSKIAPWLHAAVDDAEAMGQHPHPSKARAELRALLGVAKAAEHRLAWHPFNRGNCPTCDAIAKLYRVSGVAQKPKL